MRKIAIIGANGYLGSYLTTKFKNKKIKVYEFTRQNISQFYLLKNHKEITVIFLAQKSNKNYKYNSHDLKLIKKIISMQCLHYIYISSLSLYIETQKNIMSGGENSKFKLEYNKLKKLSEENFCKTNSTIFRVGNIYDVNLKKNTLLYDIYSQLNNQKIIIQNINSTLYLIWLQDFEKLIYKSIINKNFGVFDVYDGNKIQIKKLIQILKNYNSIKQDTIIISKNSYSPQINSKKINLKNTMKKFNWKPNTKIKAALKKIKLHE